MTRRIRRRAQRAIDISVDRSLSRLRLLMGVVALVLSGRSLLSDGGTGAIVAVGASVLVMVLAFSEGLLRRRASAHVVSVAMVVFDTVAMLSALHFCDVRPGDPAALLLVLPLIAAGLRHGLLGVVLTWCLATAAVFVQLLDGWTGAAGQIEAPTIYCLLLAVVSIPTANLSDLLSEWVHRVGLERVTARRRSERLADVLEGNAAVTAAGPDDRIAVLLDWARRLVGPGVSLDDRHSQDGDDDSAEAQVVDLDGEPTVRVAIDAIGGPMLSVRYTDVDDIFSVEALEFLCLTHRSLVSVATPNDRVGRPAHGLVDRPTIERALQQRLASHRERTEIAVVSLDNLKLLNDLYGHETGDALLATTSRRLAEMHDVLQVGRLSGELLLVVVRSTGPALAPRVASALDGMVDLGSHGTTRIHHGVGTARPSADDTGPSLVRQATQAMFDDRRAQNEAFLARVDDELATESAQ